MIPIRDDNPAAKPPLITVTFIALCSLVFLWQQTLTQDAQEIVVMTMGAIPAVLIGGVSLPAEFQQLPALATIFTSMFLHGGWMHLLGNMLYLWIFGNNIEDAMGHTRFIVFYLLCGVIAVFTHALPNADSAIPMIGASGAISGVLGAYLLLYPHARVLVLIWLGFFITTVRLPAVIVLGFWFGFQLLSSAIADSQTGGVAWGAHIGGFVAGLTLIGIFKRKGVRLFAPARRDRT